MKINKRTKLKFRNALRKSISLLLALILIFEVTYADIPERKIAQEEKLHWDSGQAVRMDSHNSWKRRRLAIPQALEAASRRKLKNASKNLYSPDTNLLIYL